MQNTQGPLRVKKKGTAEIVIGTVLVIFSLVLLPYRMVGINFAVQDYFVRLMLMFCFLGGVRTLVGGIRKRGLYKRINRFAFLFDSASRLPIEDVSTLLKCSLTRLVRDVRAGQKYGVVKGLYADLIRQELVFTTKPPSDRPEPVADSEFTLSEEHKKSALPIYVFALVWAAYAVFFPFYRLVDIGLAAVVALVSFFVFSAWNNNIRVIIVKVRTAPPVAAKTGNPTVDELLSGVQEQLATLRLLEKNIDIKLRDRVGDILITTEKIIEQVGAHPEKAREIRQFFSYTLPTTINLLKNYQELRSQPVQGANITSGIEKIEGMMCTLVDSFHKQLDSLFADKALNIAVEIEVMEKMIGNTDSIINE